MHQKLPGGTFLPAAMLGKRQCGAFYCTLPLATLPCLDEKQSSQTCSCEAKWAASGVVLKLSFLSSSQKVQFKGLVEGYQIRMICDPPKGHVVLKWKGRVVRKYAHYPRATEMGNALDAHCIMHTDSMTYHHNTSEAWTQEEKRSRARCWLKQSLTKKECLGQQGKKS